MNTSLLSRIKDYLRGSPWLVVTLLGLLWLGIFAPVKVGTLLYFLTKITAVLFLLYWGDRLLFYYARPDKLLAAGKVDEFIGRIIARAIIMAGGLVAAGMQV